MEKGVWAVIHLMDKDGNILNHTNFNLKFKINCSYKQYSIVIKAVPVALFNLIRETLKYSAVTPVLDNLFIGEYDLLDRKCNNKILRSLITKEFFPLPIKRNITFQVFSKLDLVKLRTRYLDFPLLPKMKEVHFKTINDIYPCNEFL